ncbi:hypothetical protein GF386_03370 [Candidatus Pacearchaeota archaeon]|nr:hypothetical protein [Candidatus Pacearchaeota archaeon]MBD3283181.1 hypothetical protein [Candidatus Pacearchaeota archaeon]
MEIRDMQKKANELIKKIDEKTGCSHYKETTFLHLVEEIGETSRQIINPKIKRNSLNKENLKKELANCILFLSKLASDYELDLDEAVNSNINELKRRYDINDSRNLQKRKTYLKKTRMLKKPKRKKLVKKENTNKKHKKNR